MFDAREWADHYVAMLHSSDATEQENAYFSLIEANESIIPILAEYFRAEPDAEIRATLVQVAGEYHVPDSLRLLAEALEDPVDEVWKCSLDGLVAIGSSGALEVLREARTRAASGQRDVGFLRWVDDAIDQVMHGEFGQNETPSDDPADGWA
jgi:hypothetical protein